MNKKKKILPKKYFKKIDIQSINLQCYTAVQYIPLTDDASSDEKGSQTASKTWKPIFIGKYFGFYVLFIL
jgi:hypothetical protein